MAAGSTYTPIATTTLGTSAASYTFSSIPSTYTDLVLSIQAKSVTSLTNCILTFGDTSNLYSRTQFRADGTNILGVAADNEAQMYFCTVGTAGVTQGVAHIMDYASTTMYKNSFTLDSSASNAGMCQRITLWKNTSAISTIVIKADGDLLAADSTFTLYGILAA